MLFSTLSELVSTLITLLGRFLLFFFLFLLVAGATETASESEDIVVVTLSVLDLGAGSLSFSAGDSTTKAQRESRLGRIKLGSMRTGVIAQED
jgi:hypothetical protein